MILKSADSRQQIIDQLRDLLTMDPPSDVRWKIQNALDSIVKGVEGEREVAKNLNRRYGGNDRYAVLHDLHIRIGDVSVQIDHLVIHRLLGTAYVFETKNMPGGLRVDASGHWYAGSKDKPTAIASPLVQARSAADLMQEWFNKERGGAVTGVLAVVVTTVATTVEGKVGENLIRSDGIDEWADQTFNDRSLYDMLSRLIMSKRRGLDADWLRTLGSDLVKQHRPLKVDPVSKFNWRPNPVRRDVRRDAAEDVYEMTDRIEIGGGVVLKRNYQGYAIKHGSDARAAEVAAEIGSRHGRWNDKWGNWNIPQAAAKEVAAAIRERLS